MHFWVMFGWHSNFFQSHCKLMYTNFHLVIQLSSILYQQFSSIYGKVWQIQFLVVLLNIPSSPAQLFLPPSLNVLPEIEPLSDPFVDEFEFGGVDQESKDEASIPYPAETFVDQRSVNNILFLEFLSSSNILYLSFSP